MTAENRTAPTIGVALSVLIATLALAGAEGSDQIAAAAGGAARALGRLRDVGAERLLIFGDDNNRVFLGCLNCLEIDPESVRNEVGRFGSSVSRTSIRNRISKYGSSIHRTSACNEIATAPPVVVDEEGNYYGELTRNIIRAKRISEPWVVALLSELCEEE